MVGPSFSGASHRSESSASLQTIQLDEFATLSQYSNLLLLHFKQEQVHLTTRNSYSAKPLFKDKERGILQAHIL